MKSIKWLSGSICLLFLSIIPAINSKAFATQSEPNGTDCYALSLISNQNLSIEQQKTALQCDHAEAEQAWNNQYGNMNVNDISSAIIYDPS